MGRPRTNDGFAISRHIHLRTEDGIMIPERAWSQTDSHHGGRSLAAGFNSGPCRPMRLAHSGSICSKYIHDNPVREESARRFSYHTRAVAGERTKRSLRANLVPSCWPMYRNINARHHPQNRTSIAASRAESTALRRNPGVRPRHTAESNIAITKISARSWQM